MERFRVKVQGTCPLLMHKFSDAATAELEGRVKQRSSGPPDAKDEAEEGAYRLDPEKGEKLGQLCLPSEHFFQAMVAAASGFQVKGQGKKTYKDAVKGNVNVEPEYVGLTNGDGVLTDYNIDSRPVRIQKARIMRRRPRLESWEAEFDIVVTDSKAIHAENIKAILDSAGATKGVGDYRPRFGRFMVIGFKKLTA